jgi:predicted nucleotide-binding protein
MALVDTTAVRSATVRTREATVVAKVCESQFTRIANKHPSLWRRMAVALAKRLRERNKFQTPPRTEPVIFIGSSSEGLSVAKCIQKYLLRHPFVPRIWSDGVFECSKTTIEDLMQITKETDFAVLVLTPDDVTKSRGKNKPSPRDNVVFEMGLFMGALSRERTYIVAPRKLDIKIPTDLLGVKCLLYQKRRGRSLARNLQPVSRDLSRLISKHGPM